jgi:allantoinase
MTEHDTVFRARRLVTAAGDGSGWVGVMDGRIAAIAPLEAGLEGRRVVELGEDVVLLPGLVDSQVHVNEPGRTEWEGFATATRAAAAGGVTTIIDMPLNSIPPMHPANLDGHLRVLRGFDGLLIVHAEDAGAIDRAPSAHGARYLDFLASRPRAAENTAIEQVIRAAERTGARVHILHLSSSDALPMIAGARREGIRITAETCPHYLVLTAEEVRRWRHAVQVLPAGARGGQPGAALAGLEGGTIDCVVSDHSPCTAELKRLDTGDFGAAWGGISSLEIGLPLVWTEARRRGFGLRDIVRWMAERPARLVGLRHKGRIEVGYDADFCVFAPDEVRVVDPKRLHHKHPITPYGGRALLGVVHRTWCAARSLPAISRADAC